MIDKWLSKTKFKEGYEKVVRKIIVSKISANQLTIVGLVIGLVSSAFIYLSSFYTEQMITFIILSLIFTIISFFIDTLDGSVARYEGPTIFGGILDIFCDRLVEVSIIIAIVATDPSNLVWPGLFTLSAIVLCISMFLIVGGIIKREEQNQDSKVIVYQSGLMERSETFFFLLAIILLIPWRFFILWIFATLIFITALLRLKDAYNIFKSEAE
ncbi:MAG: CDP-alcohol phosphatidyltransferase family protein [Candidatus Lokiarchaeota archaeon]|nr:CDP-alcohol phosphatidyltransferase family protein [Candidatus Lokiarchaeota archaeon]